MLGIILAIAAAVCWGAGAILVRLGLQGIKPSTGTLISMISSVIVVGIIAFIVDYDALVHLSLSAILWFSLIGVVNYLLGRQFNYTSIRYIGVTRATPIFASAPLFALILAVSFIGESVNPAIVIGTLTIVAGLYLVMTSK